MNYPIPDDEDERIRELRDLGILDTLPEDGYNQIVEMVALLCEVPIALVSFVDRDRQWFKASYGLDVSETPRELSFCTHSILSPDILEINNALRDSRFTDNPLVTGAPGIRYYAGAPLITANGHRLGTLCVIDTVPRTLTPSQKRVLTTLANQVTTLLDLRDKTLRLEREVVEREWMEDALRLEHGILNSLVQASKDAIFVKNREGRYISVNPAAARLMGHTASWILGKDDCTLMGAEAGMAIMRSDREVLESGISQTVMERANIAGDQRILQTTKSVCYADNGKVLGVVGIARDVTEQAESNKLIKDKTAELQAVIGSLPDVYIRLNSSLRILDIQIPSGFPIASNSTKIPRVGDSLQRLDGNLGCPLLGQVARDVLQTQLPRELEYSVGTGDDLRSREARVMPLNSRQIIMVIRDITDRRAAQQGLERHLQMMSALRNIDIAISSSIDLRLTLSVVLDQVMTQLDVDGANILLFNPLSHTLEYACQRGAEPYHGRTTWRLGEGLVGRAAHERRMYTRSDEDGINFSGAGYYVAPLIAKGHLEGVLEVYHTEPRPIAPEWLKFLEMLTGQAAIAIDNATLFDDLQRTNLDLLMAYDETIEGWSHALDLRDKETEGHSHRVTEITLRMARRYGVSEHDLVHIRRGALLHDIGKLGVPDNILLKDGPLGTAEWEIMRRHTQYAFEMLSPIAFLRPALEIPYCHHERWDGTGYPRGLQGEQIPLAARIFALADVWDALRSNRPYRKSWCVDQVRQFIQAEKGSHFDPNLVDLFLSIDISDLAPSTSKSNSALPGI